MLSEILQFFKNPEWKAALHYKHHWIHIPSFQKTEKQIFVFEKTLGWVNLAPSEFDMFKRQFPIIFCINRIFLKFIKILQFQCFQKKNIIQSNFPTWMSFLHCFITFSQSFQILFISTLHSEENCMHSHVPTEFTEKMTVNIDLGWQYAIELCRPIVILYWEKSIMVDW